MVFELYLSAIRKIMEMPVRVLLTWLALCSAAVAQSTLNVSEDLVQLGIASTNMVPNLLSQDAGPLFFRAVSYANNHQIGRVIADPGAYYFRSLQYAGAHVAWDKLSDLTIDLQGSDFYFSFPLTQGILITHSTNIVFENFTADYDPLPFTQVRVVSVNPTQQSIQFAVDGNWQNPTALNAVFPFVPSTYGFGVEVHMFRNGRPIPGVTRMYAANPIGSTQFTATPDPGVSPSAVFAQIRPGDIAFLGMRWGAGPFSVLYCTGCTFRNIAVYSGTQWGFLAAHMQSSVFERIYSLPRPATDRLASNYVGLLLTDVGPNNQIRLNRTIRSMDDGLEYDASFLGTVKNQTDNRTFVLEGSNVTKLSYGDSVPNGSPVAFQRLSDGAILTSAVIVSQVAPPYTGQNPYQVTFAFDRDLPASIVGTLMLGTDLNQRGGNSVLERNALEEETDCCAGFLVAGLLNGIFRGNYIQRSGMTGLHTENSVQPGNFDLPPTTNFNITNNVIDGANWTRTGYPTLQLGSIQIDSTNAPRMQTASPNQNISITSNFIADSGSAAVWLGNTSGGSVSGNYFLNPDSNPAVVSSVAFFGPSQPLVVQASQNVATSNNLIDQTSGRIWVTDTQFRERAAYGPGSIVRLNAYGLGTFFSAPSVILTDADGNAVPAAFQAITTHAIEVQIPTSAALGGAYLTLTSGSMKYFGTLFLDSQDNIPALNGCTYEVSPAASSTGANANNLAILVVTQAECSYEVLGKDPFLAASAGATGTAVVSVGFSANSGAARTTTIEIAGQSITLTQAAAGTARPVIQAISDTWNYGSGLAPGEWVTINGTALAAGPPRTWNLNGTQQLPTSLGEVTVSFNGTPAALYYVSATQINALVPATVAPGSVQVIVQSNGVSSNPFTVTATATLPAIYALPNADGSTFFVTAALGGTATLVGNSAVDPRVLRAAQPGDILDLYMIGLGATADPTKFVTNQLFSGAYPVSATVTATVGGEKAPVSFAGLTSPGLYLVRITLPADLAAGPRPIQISTGALKTGSSLVLMLGLAQ